MDRAYGTALFTRAAPKGCNQVGSGLGHLPLDIKASRALHSSYAEAQLILKQLEHKYSS